ncbi:hypothetical protein MNBD_CHLOROFLEXI01-265 [hydrothermal vent metagenome]|uniref:Uncharacterized protein n=1 Tax=hydrothermal vent metagenome TaxID=652676 RepID=A0A3B0VBN6_9ZZZZ
MIRRLFLIICRNKLDLILGIIFVSSFNWLATRLGGYAKFSFG